MYNTLRDVWDMIHVSLWHETQAPFGIANHKTGDRHWTRQQIIDRCNNSDVLNNYKRKEINQVTVLETLGGDYTIIQIAGYSYNRGCYCDVI